MVVPLGVARIYPAPSVEGVSTDASAVHTEAQLGAVAASRARGARTHDQTRGPVGGGNGWRIIEKI